MGIGQGVLEEERGVEDRADMAEREEEAENQVDREAVDRGAEEVVVEVVGEEAAVAEEEVAAEGAMTGEMILTPPSEMRGRNSQRVWVTPWGEPSGSM